MQELKKTVGHKVEVQQVCTRGRGDRWFLSGRHGCKKVQVLDQGKGEEARALGAC